MSVLTITNKMQECSNLFNRVVEKRDYHDKKWHRARKRESIDFHYDRYKLFNDISWRLTTLSFSLRKDEKFGNTPSFLKWDPELYKERLAVKKEKGRLKFENNYQVYLHFMQERFGADYGTFLCDKCNGTFHHSPSDVYRGAKKEYSSCCGHCVNSMLRFNGQEEIYN